jgi:hypothetical protein
MSQFKEMMMRKPEPCKIQDFDLWTTSENDHTVEIRDNREEKSIDIERIKRRLNEGIEPAAEAEAEPATKPATKTGTKVKIPGAPPKPRAKRANTIVKPVLLTEANIKKRVPKPREKVIYKTSSYYMNNRKISIEKINNLLNKYHGALNVEGDGEKKDFDLMTHQKVVRDYLNLLTPYRGLLLLHALGSGKTCTSVAIAEGMKSDKQIYIMTPASLKMNFFSELKRCGDPLFRKNQFWEFVAIEGQPDYVELLSKTLSLPREFIETHRGAWMVDVSKETNYPDLTPNEQATIDDQLNAMIRSKYKDINYNGLNMNKINELTGDQTRNPFDHSVVVIDEAHNFVSRIVNKINKPKTIPNMLYELLMSATDVRIVMLTGTPIINYPNEIGILYNILRGYIKTWTFPITITSETRIKVSQEEIKKLLNANGMNTYDFLEYSGDRLTVTRNPFGFVNVITKTGAYSGVRLDDTGNMSDADFKSEIIRILDVAHIKVADRAIKVDNYKALPDTKDEFLNMFIDEEDVVVKNDNLFKRRILGLTSYFYNTQDNLLPTIVQSEAGSNYNLVAAEMSEFQFSEYERIRKDEADQEKRMRQQKAKQKPDELYQMNSTYRIFSRACCNFAFPKPPGRPMPDTKEVDEASLDSVPKDAVDDYADADDVEPGETRDYMERIQLAMKFLSDNPNEYLSPEALEKYSPKFARVLENLTDADNAGLHLVYSQFRTIEGIGILKLVLEANGYAEFKIQKAAKDDWQIVELEEDKDKPKFFLYTGTETVEEKEILRNIYNSQWDFVPQSIVAKMKEKADNNMMGEIVKIMMITSSGAEGINLRNTRFVHIVEPYWHMVRLDQVVGRARRIGSHLDLPEEMRTVKVFLYIATLSEAQSKNEKNKELIIRDVSKLDKKTPLTTDESLYEISRIKDNINSQLITAVKESAIDCSLYSGTSKEKLVCYGFGNIKSDQFGTFPSIDIDQHQKEELNVKEKKVRMRKLQVAGVDYAYDQTGNRVYDYESFMKSNKNLVLLGKLDGNGKVVPVDE